MKFELKARYNGDELRKFANYMNDLQEQMDFKVSSRGWAYILEGNRLINKDQFDRVEVLINDCRRKGFLPVDFVAEESSRQFHGIEKPNSNTVVEDFGEWIEAAMRADENFTPDWWDGEEYYIQMVVEKVDLVTLFQPVCQDFHIPIANSKGWSSISQRAEYARRFREAEQKGLTPLLLYCGDHDADGLRISDTIRKNIDDLKDIRWSDGTHGYDPSNLQIMRFGLNYDFIKKNKLTWIDNLITGSGANLASTSHKNHYLPYVQDYLKKYGARKVEANAIVTKPDAARKLVKDAIESFIGEDAQIRFEEKRQAVRDEFQKFLDISDLNESFDKALKIISDYRK